MPSPRCYLVKDKVILEPKFSAHIYNQAKSPVCYSTCLLNLYHNMYIYIYVLCIHYIRMYIISICIYMYVYCGLQLPFIAHHCLSLFLMFHGELRNLKPLRRAFRLMPRSILQGAHGSDICSYVPQLPDFLGAVNKNLKPRNKSTKNSTTALLLGPLGLSFQVFNCI